MANLKEILRDSKIKQAEIQEILNIKSQSTMSLKLNNKAEFTTKEANILKNYINNKTGKNYTLEDLFPV